MAAWGAIFCALSTSLVAQTATTWTATSDTTFATSGNWSAGAPVNDILSSVATFDGTSTVNPELTASQSVRGLSFTGGGYTFSASGGAVLTLGVGGVSATAGTHTVSSGLTLSSGVTETWSIASGSQVTASGVISGSGRITKSGAGTLVLSGANLNTGLITLNSGTLALNSAGALGAASQLTVGNGTLDNTSGAALTLTGNTPLSIGTFGFKFAGTDDLIFGTGAVTLNNSVTDFTVTAKSVTLGGVIKASGTAGITKRGSGTLVLTGASTYNAATMISAGTLQIGAGGTTGSIATDVTNNAALVFNRSDNISFSKVISGSGTVTQAGSGTLTLSAANTYTGTTTIKAGTLALGATGTIANSATINLGTTASPGILSLTAKSAFSFGSGQTVAGVGTINIGAGKTVTIAGPFTPGNSTGIVTVTGDLTLASTAATTLEINLATAGTGYDQVNVSGLTTYGGALTLAFGTTFADGTSLQLFGLSSSGSAGAFSSVVATGNYSGAFSYDSTGWTYANGTQTLTFDPSTGALTISASAIPEPSTYAVFLGVVALGGAVYRRRRV